MRVTFPVIDDDKRASELQHRLATFPNEVLELVFVQVF